MHVLYIYIHMMYEYWIHVLNIQYVTLHIPGITKTLDNKPSEAEVEQEFPVVISKYIEHARRLETTGCFCVKTKILVEIHPCIPKREGFGWIHWCEKLAQQLRVVVG